MAVPSFSTVPGAGVPSWLAAQILHVDVEVEGGAGRGAGGPGREPGGAAGLGVGVWWLEQVDDCLGVGEGAEGAGAAFVEGGLVAEAA